MYQVPPCLQLLTRHQKIPSLSQITTKMEKSLHYLKQLKTFWQAIQSIIRSISQPLRPRFPRKNNFLLTDLPLFSRCRSKPMPVLSIWINLWSIKNRKEKFAPQAISTLPWLSILINKIREQGLPQAWAHTRHSHRKLLWAQLKIWTLKNHLESQAQS